MPTFNEFINSDGLEAKAAKIFILLTGTLIICGLLLGTSLGKLVFENTIISIIIFIFSTKYILFYKKTERIKKRTSIFILSYFFCFLPIFSYFQVLNLISAIQPSVFYDYATKGQYEKEVIFTKENLYDNELSNTITQIFKEDNIDTNNLRTKQSIYGALNSNKETTRSLLDSNLKFQEYLKTINWSTNDVIEYIGKFADLDQIVLKCSMYISLFLALLFCLLKTNIRAELYVIAGFIYIISVSGQITNDFTSVIIFKGFPYNEVSQITSVINVVKESFLTFIIFDTLFQLISDKKNNDERLEITEENKNKFKKEIENEFKQEIKNEIKKEIKNELKSDINKLINIKEISSESQTNNKNTAKNRSKSK